MKAPTTSRHGFALFALFCLVLQLVPLDLVTAQSGGNLDLRRNVIAGGGNTSSGGANLQISGTVGQAAAGTQTAGRPVSPGGGFWPAVPGVALLPPPLPRAGGLHFNTAFSTTLQ